MENEDIQLRYLKNIGQIRHVKKKDKSSRKCVSRKRVNWSSSISHLKQCYEYIFNVMLTFDPSLTSKRKGLKLRGYSSYSHTGPRQAKVYLLSSLCASSTEERDIRKRICVPVLEVESAKLWSNQLSVHNGTYGCVPTQ
ncbi:cullin-5-like isoform 1 [Cricetulus griseus]|nr:cullin-5-like isoform 1 [Cricetulus griseus]